MYVTVRLPPKVIPKLFARYFQGMIERGVYLPPSQFETAFISLAHSEAEVQETVAAAKDVLRSMH